MMSYAYDLSEKLQLPILMRVTTRMAHSRAVVKLADTPREPNDLNYNAKASNWVLLPAFARKRNDVVTSQQPLLEQMAVDSPFNRYVEGQRTTDNGQQMTDNGQQMTDNGQQMTDNGLGIIASGIAYNYLMESFPNGCPFPVLKVSQYPLPKKLVRRMTDDCEEVLICEEGQPFIEDMVRGVMPGNAVIRGRLTGQLPRTGELNPDVVKKALRLLTKDSGQTPLQFPRGGVATDCGGFAPCEDVVPRPPALCQGCGHRDVYTALNKVLLNYPNARVFGDIGCYTLGFLPPYKAIHSCVDMGASITMAKGASDAGQWPSLAIIGDSTFTHSGMTGLLDAVNENSDITVIISDNLTTAMTGGQDSAGTNKFEAICRGLGVSEEHLHVVVPLPKNMEEITRIIEEEINYHGVSVIIPRRECMQTLQRHLKQKKAEKSDK